MGFYLNVENNKIISASNQPINRGTIKSYSVEQQVYYDYMANEDKYIVQNNQIVVDPEWAPKMQAKREQEFKRQFFNTSLGWIRRKVSMATGEYKDFLSDLLPTITIGIQMGQPVTIITYKEPDYTKEATTEYMQSLQEVKAANAEFVQECFAQLSNDFLPSNE